MGFSRLRVCFFGVSGLGFKVEAIFAVLSSMWI